MEYLVIRGGRPLYGRVAAHGAKNSVLPILAATLLSDRRCVITGCPDISDVETALSILNVLGCRTERLGTAVVVDPAHASLHNIPSELTGAMRASVTFLGAMLARFGAGVLSAPGGCRLGRRPVDYHMEALRRLGVEFLPDGEDWQCLWRRRRGGEISLPYPSVGATENLLLAAAGAPEPVMIRGGAKEPEVTDLCGFLRAMGVHVTGDGTDEIVVRGGTTLSGAAYHVLPDRMETASYLAMAAACGGDVTVEDTDPALLRPVTQILRQAGCDVLEEERKIRLCRTEPLRGVGRIETSPYPGFPTDAQAPVMAALLKAQGDSEIRETVFPDRFAHTAQLQKFGARVDVMGSAATIHGVKRLHAAEAEATDLRGGMAAVIAALSAEGVSRIGGLPLIDRGYAHWKENLLRLGAQLER